MAAPVEVVEAFIPHLPDATVEQKRRSAMVMIRGLELNGYFFMRRRTSTTPMLSGECVKCGCDMVHVEHDKTWKEPQARIDNSERMLYALNVEAEQMRSFIQSIGEGKIATIEQAKEIANKGLLHMHAGRVKMLTPEQIEEIVPPGSVMRVDAPPN